MAGQSFCTAGFSAALLLCVVSLAWAAPLVVVTKTDWSEPTVSEVENSGVGTVPGRSPVPTDGLPPPAHLPAPHAPLAPSGKTADSGEGNTAQDPTLQVNTS